MSRRDRLTPSGILPDEVFVYRADGVPASGPAVEVSPGEHELPAIGSLLDRYRIEDVIGRGAFAVVFRARHVLLDMPVAIKLLRPRLLRRNPAMASLLCAEARLAARINHPNVARVHDVQHGDAVTFIVMELCKGETLAELIGRRGPLRPTKVLRIGHAVASGLRAGLAEHVIHRDVKPTNIVLTADGEAKVVDLGLARSIADPTGEREPSSGLIGTPGYMAPEQATDPARADFRADIYALGVTLYHAAVGAPPFPTDDPVRAISLHQTQPIPPPSQRAPGLPIELERLLLWMLEREPSLRPASYDVLLAAIKRAHDAISRR